MVTFGCRLNACESEVLRAQAVADGIADAVIFNTCAVTGEAVRQARQAIRKARRERPASAIIVTGCAAQIDPQGFADMDGVDLVVGNGEKSAPGGLARTGPRVRVGDIMQSRDAAVGAITPFALAGPARPRAYVEIQNGCDHRCTFCVIPFGRGNSRSVPAATIIERVGTLATAGCAEVVLTGVDLTSWGADLATHGSLGVLVRGILASVPELRRLRLSSIDAAEIDDELMACMASEARLMPHLHLSLQAGDDLILKRMKRRHSRDDALALVAKVRAARPGMAFGADLIAGFPTESEAAFENSLSLVEAAGLAFVHVFPYSPRPGTPAARMPQLSPATIKSRAARLREAADAALVRHLDRHAGLEIHALVERPGLARAEDFTVVTFAGSAPPGAIIRGAVAGHDGRRARLETWEIAA